MTQSLNAVQQQHEDGELDKAMPINTDLTQAQSQLDRAPAQWTSACGTKFAVSILSPLGCCCTFEDLCGC